MSSTATPPELAAGTADASGDISGPFPELTGARRHWRALEGLYASAPINREFPSHLEIIEEGFARIRFEVGPEHCHAAGAAHGTLYFKMLDDAAFYAANTLVTDRFLLTTAFNLLFTRPLQQGEAVAEGRWVSGRRRVILAEARIIDSAGNEVGRGTGTFQRSRIALSALPGYVSSASPGASLP
ncbi:PaaI family thioesterase [Novosphingobium sp.]|uniref:PaaI family thioesterase n=1 Tax=Novosphingobium sp. TaxID=1874826 RepID=UPI003BAA39B4